MLVEFRIRNFALVDDLTIGFGPGLNILTGETGAGKSVIVTALSVLLGAQPTGPLVRAGCEHARLDAVFHTNDAEAARVLRESGIEPEEDGSLSLSREFTAQKRSTTRINGSAAPLSLLKNLSERLVDLHGQYAHQTLLRSNDHSMFLDASGGAGHRKLLGQMSDCFQAMRRARARLNELRNNSDRLAAEADMLRFRVNEIDSLLSAPEDFEELKRDINALEHSRELAQAVNAAFDAISRSGSDSSALNRTAAALHAAAKVRGIEPTLDGALAQLDEADSLLDSAARTLGSLRGRFHDDPARLDDLQERLLQIKDILKKTNSATVEELFEYKRRSEERLDAISVDEAGMERLEKEAREFELKAADTAMKLTASRTKLAADFSKKMQRELKDLAMPGAVFEAASMPLNDGEKVLGAEGREMLLREGGAERIEFRISPNPGEPPRPLALIASGGEISRVMLAFKSLLRGVDGVPVQVFDEIDAGIGGETAHSIAGKMAALAADMQVVSITHLPQIAAAADRHITARKEQAGGRTVIRAAEVTGRERLREMTRMLGATGMQESEDLANKMIHNAKMMKGKEKK